MHGDAEHWRVLVFALIRHTGAASNNMPLLQKNSPVDRRKPQAPARN